MNKPRENRVECFIPAKGLPRHQQQPPQSPSPWPCFWQLVAKHEALNLAHPHLHSAAGDQKRPGQTSSLCFKTGSKRECDINCWRLPRRRGEEVCGRSIFLSGACRSVRRLVGWRRSPGWLEQERAREKREKKEEVCVVCSAHCQPTPPMVQRL